MKTIRDSGEYISNFSLHLPHPFAQPGVVWKILKHEDLNAAVKMFNLRVTDPGNLFKDSQKLLGEPKQYCVLGDNVIGVTNWSKVSLEAQYDAVTKHAGAFIASAMTYIKVSGSNAGLVLDMLSPRIVSSLLTNQSKFVLFTTPAGTVDEEAIIIRTGETEFLMSCGGGKWPKFLSAVANQLGGAAVEESNTYSFNIKGPKRLAAVQSLLKPAYLDIVAELKNFESCLVQPLVGGQARVLKTIIGYEVWAEEQNLSAIWLQLLRERPYIVPCAWDLLNIYRLECADIMFGLYPVDFHFGTTLFEIGCGWMMKENNSSPYIGKEALLMLNEKKRFWLAGLCFDDPGILPPRSGREVFSSQGDFLGYITTAAFSPKYQKILAFAHLLPSCSPGQYVVSDNRTGQVVKLPFTYSQRDIL